MLFINKLINENKKNNINFLIYFLYIIGLIIGIVSSKNQNFTINDQYFSIKHLITIFCMTFFMFFVLLQLKNNVLFYLFYPVCIIFRGFSLGVLINALLLNNYIYCILIVLIEIIIIVNLFIFLINIKNKEDYKAISIITFVILFYSIILELVGDKFG